ncbi:hypothetical protein H4R34_001471 [Dimargaris verticillata]|uniref:ABC1 atypical kinase-like domain-containing protein n=1 Tax=Dimargaris verticillata TaxID=2761393 RepID=A0A9W8EDS1_9FUNG|nr:hypothetical protein H4R34_001471 [Dimargaris verticillata]
MALALKRCPGALRPPLLLRPAWSYPMRVPLRSCSQHRLNWTLVRPTPRGTSPVLWTNCGNARRYRVGWPMRITAIALLTTGALLGVTTPNRLACNVGSTEPAACTIPALTPLAHQEPTGLVATLFRWWRQAMTLLDRCVLEPIKVVLRMGTLWLLVFPLVVTYPLGYFGKSLPDHHDETTGRVWWYRFVTKQMARAGPTFIKLAQWAASRSDIFPAEFCHQLSRLHSQNTPHSFRNTRATVERAFGGRTLEELFETFDPVPLGTGAIAQVYRAQFRPGVGRQLLALNHNPPTTLTDPGPCPDSGPVAIKVLHPRVDKLIRRDLVIMEFMAQMLDWIPTMQWVSLPDEVRQFGRMMQSQLDLRVEANNLLQFRRLFAERPSVIFPYAWLPLCSRDVLVESYENAIPLELVLRNRGSAFDRRIAGLGLDAFLRMVIYDNFIHADLHPGNILVTFTWPVQSHWFDRLLDRLLAGPEHASRQQTLAQWAQACQLPTNTDTVAHGTPRQQEQVLINQILQVLARDKKRPHAFLADLAALGCVPQLVFLDTGLVATLNDTNRRNFLDLFQAIAEFDGYRTGRLMVDRCRMPQLVLEPDIFALKMQHLILQVRHKTLKLSQVSIGDLLHQVMTMVRQHHVKLEGDFVNVVISILILEGIGRQLDPDVDLLKVALPILRSYGLEQGSRATLDTVRQGSQGKLGGFAWWLKVWIWLEAREWVSEVRQFEFEDDLFGENMYPDV